MSEDEIAIKVDHVKKTFKLPHEKTSSIKGALINFARHKKGFETQHVLKDVTFEVRKGEFFGIVGRNGSGKSTLLKLLAGIYSPDNGGIQTNGRLTPFIELGVGFNPELTGRENVFLNGALLGFNRKQMAAKYHDIVAFAELERFMDQKLKNYSSGMQVRLAFSIAIQARSDILVLDEVLAVGDEAFQQKCVSVFEQYKAQKQTIILVTHDMGVVERFCTRALMLQDGEIVKIGTPRVVAKLYSDANKNAYADQEMIEEANKAQGDITMTLRDDAGNEARRFKQGDRLNVTVSWHRDDGRNVGVAIMKQSGEYIFGPNTIKEKFDLKGRKEVGYSVVLNLGPGEYYLKAGLFGKMDKQVLEFIDEGPRFMIDAKTNENWGGLTKLDYEWKLHA